MDQTAPSVASAGSIQANNSGEINGQVAIGSYILQIGAIEGSTVNINLPDQRPHLIARSTPVYVLPRRFSRLLDRTEELKTAAEALPATQPVEFHAQSGAGKTSHLRVIARHSLATAFPDGVLYFSVRYQKPTDLLQSIFDALFEYNAPYKPSDGEIRLALQHKRALILLGDVELSREVIESLFDAAPSCAFLLVSPDKRLWGEGHSIALPGLPPAEARMLLERELGRPLDSEESAAVDELVSILGGCPLALIQAAALVREANLRLDALVAERDPEPKKKLAALFLGLLTKPEQAIAASLAALDGVPLSANHLPALTGVPNAEAVLAWMQKRGLVQSSGKGYTLAGAFTLVIQGTWDLGGTREELVRYFQSWVTARIHEPRSILDELDVLQRLVEWAGAEGRWESVLDLVKLVEGALALTRRWGTWETFLQKGLEAAQAAGKLKAKAWAFHQLGTMALCLDEKLTARRLLVRALR